VNNIVNMYTILAFVLGVLLSAMVKGWASSAKSKLA
jgi:hypothetical protein